MKKIMTHSFFDAVSTVNHLLFSVFESYFNDAVNTVVDLGSSFTANSQTPRRKLS